MTANETPVVSNVWERPAEDFEKNVASAFQRFADHADLKSLLKVRAVAVGCGSVGSWSILAAAKTGITDWLVVDFDKVEIQNTANQIWGPAHLGKSKSSLMGGMLRASGFTRTVEFQDRAFIESDVIGREIVLCCVDNMKARRQIFDAVCEAGEARFFFDARTGGGYLRVFMLDPTDLSARAKYAKNLQEDTGTNFAEFRCTDVGGVSSPMMAAAILSIGLTKYSEGKFGPYYVYGEVGKDFNVVANTLSSVRRVPVATAPPPVSPPTVLLEAPAVVKNLQARLKTKADPPVAPTTG